MVDTTVKFFTSTMTSAPVLTGQTGSLIAVLDACLVNGFGSVTLDSLVVASNVATGTKSTGHGLSTSYSHVILIAGATPSSLNGEWRVTATSSTQFTFATTGISDQTATGTITANRAPAGWSKAFSETNNAVYRSNDIAGSKLYLRVNDNNTGDARFCYFRMYETMSDVYTGTNPSTERVTIKSNSADATGRAWRLYADSRAVYCFMDRAGDISWSGGVFFGDLVAYRSPDAYACALISGLSAAYPEFQLYQLNTPYMEIDRSSAQTGTIVAASNVSHLKTPSYLCTGGANYPAAADNSFHAWPVETWDTLGPRGLMPGLLNPIHNTTLTQGIFISNIPDLEGGTVFIQSLVTSYRAAIILDRAWR